jgi:hypothetical protein
VRKLRCPSEPFLIRPMTSDDMPEVMELERIAFTHPWSPELLRPRLRPSFILLVEEELPRVLRLLDFAIFWVVRDGCTSSTSPRIKGSSEGGAR